VLEKILKGSGECAEVGWRFIGLSIAEWSLIWFGLLAALAVAVALSANRRNKP
jgi:disulfide bond formation protein DsbB